MSWLNVAGQRIWYTRYGAGDPMLMLHHGEADHRLWDYQVEHFGATFDVVAPDLLGFGHSDKPRVAYTLDMYASLLARFIHDLDLDPAILVGACMGGAMSLRYTYEHPEAVRALVLVNPLTSDTIAAGVLARQTRRVASSPLYRASLRSAVRYGLIPPPVLMRPLRAAFGDTVDKGWLGYFGDQRWRDRRSILAWISQGQHIASYTPPPAAKPEGFPPVCTVWGGANQILPPAAGHQFNEILQPGEEHVLDGAGHMLPLERPHELNSIIESFLDRAAVGPAGAGRPASWGSTRSA